MGRFHTIHLKLIVTALMFAAMPVAACWMGASLPGRVSSADIIVIGRIASVEVASTGADYDYDVAHLIIERFVKGDDVLQKTSGREGRIRLRFPSVNNRVRLSTDIKYKKDQSGIWLLDREGGHYTAHHPFALVPTSKLREIQSLLKSESTSHTRQNLDRRYF
jgi:hypothetical protein